MRLVRRLSLPDADDQALCLATEGSPSFTFTASTELGWLCKYDLRLRSRDQRAWQHRVSEDSEAASVCVHPKEPNRLYVSLGARVCEVDERKLNSENENAQASEWLSVVSTSDEEVNQVVVHPSGEFLASADDSGCVRVVRLKDKTTFKHLRRGHSNICSCVAFRPRQPWEVFSGGLDCLLLLWDFNRGKQRLACRAEVAAGASESQLFNPPFVHALAVPTRRELANHVAAARGDGKVAVYDIAKAKVNRTVCLSGEGASSGGHTASIGHICFTNFNGEKHLLSGGNDGKVVLWNWMQSFADPEPDPNESVLEWSHKHGQKINWTATTTTSSENILVADTSNCVSVYSTC